MQVSIFIYLRHTICTQCISEWGRKSTATCPFCRTVLKKMKGNFGKMDKLTEKKIDQLVLRCGGCQWKGSPKKYFEDFGINPSLDDNVMPCEKMHEEEV